MDEKQLIAARAQKDHFFKTHSQSPLTETQRQHFTGLSYFDYNPELILLLTIPPFERHNQIQVETTQERPRMYTRYGEFRLTIDGKEARLTIFQTPHGFFLPFVDSLAGLDTYPAGRYLEPEHLNDDQFRIDFNQAYNPYCAYNERYDCPITPFENRLSIPIRAGEKMPQGAWVRIR